MIIKNTFTMTVDDDPLGEPDEYCFNLKNCMYMARNTPMCIRFIFGTHNLVLKFRSLDSVKKYFALFQDFFEGKIDCVEINELELESREIEVKE